MTTDATEIIVDIASAHIDCGFGMRHVEDEPSRPYTDEEAQRYIDLCWPLDRKVDQLDFAKNQYSCALAAKGVLRRAGVRHRLLEEAYAKQYLRPGGDAVSQIQIIGKDLGAWRDPRGQKDGPPRGAVVLINHPGTNEAHVLIALSHGLDGIFTSVDGGQGGKGSYHIAYKTRRLGWEDKIGFWRCYEGPNLDQPARVVIGWIDPKGVLS